MADSKPLWQSKTFWLNVIGMAAMFAPAVPLEPETMVYVLGGLNVATRMITKGPTHVLRKAVED